MTKNTITIHTVSDSTGETVQGVARAVGVRFENAVIVDWTLIKTTAQIEKIGKEINSDSVVIYTLVDQDLVDALEGACKEKKAVSSSVLKPVAKLVKSLGGVEKEIIAGAQHAMDDEYFARVDAIDFASVHDDGKNTHNLADSDIVIVGVSRTSKTPTSFYLANRGLKTSNIPFVGGIDLPETLFNLPPNVFVIGLTRDAESLVNIRKTRMESLNMVDKNDYVDVEKVEQEINELKNICGSNEWPMINVKYKSIEETSTQIIKYLNRHQERLKQVNE